MKPIIEKERVVLIPLSRPPPQLRCSAISCNLGLMTCLASFKTATRSAALFELLGVKNV